MNMSESIQHLQLVNALKIEMVSYVPEDCWKLIQIDSPGSVNPPPYTTDGYRPDAYYQFRDLLVIGEAKTANDVDTRHSRAQYESYLKECSRFQGHSRFIMIVPLLSQASAHNILRNMRRVTPGDYAIVVKGWWEGAL